MVDAEWRDDEETGAVEPGIGRESRKIMGGPPQRGEVRDVEIEDWKYKHELLRDR